jgi:hypothetical protein
MTPSSAPIACTSAYKINHFPPDSAISKPPSAPPQLLSGSIASKASLEVQTSGATHLLFSRFVRDCALSVLFRVLHRLLIQPPFRQHDSAGIGRRWWNWRRRWWWHGWRWRRHRRRRGWNGRRWYRWRRWVRKRFWQCGRVSLYGRQPAAGGRLRISDQRHNRRAHADVRLAVYG